MSQDQIIPVVLLCALPASGKSESRAFLRSLPVEQSRSEFKMGFPTIQLDDYPYVEMMRIFDNELQRLGQKRTFYWSEYFPAMNNYVWGVLVHLLNQDYHDVITKTEIHTEEPMKWMMDRFDKEFTNLGFPAPFAKYSEEIKKKLVEKFDDHVRKFLEEKNQYAAGYSKDRTIVIEFARGGGAGSERYPDFFPLPDPFGYQYSLRQFCPEILTDCAMLYIKVTPEQSFQKNLSRAPPPGWDGSGDIFHCVPEMVMRFDYGCDDFDYMVKTSEKPNTLTVVCEQDKKKYFIPVGVFDNTEDLTTFCRGAPETWPKESIEKIHKAMTAAFTNLLKQYLEIQKQ